MEKIVWGAAGMSEVTPKWSKLVRSSLLHLFYKMVIFGRLVSWFLGFSYQGDYFYQLVYTFLMLMQLSDAQNSCFKLNFGPFEANMRKGAPRGATMSVYCKSLYYRVYQIIAFQIIARSKLSRLGGGSR